MPTEIKQDDIGIVFTVTVGDEDGEALDISTASSKQLLFKKPDGSLLTKTADFVTNGTDGGIKYTSVTGDLDLAGLWQLQGYVVLGVSSGFHTDITTFVVVPNLDS